MRRFWLRRKKDETGISGPGHVLDGVVLTGGRVIVQWLGAHSSVTLHESMEAFRAVHMSPHHPGSNELVWIDHENVACRCGHPLLWHLTGGADGWLEYCEGSVNGVCACAVMQPVAFVPDVPLNVGYFSEPVTVPYPSTLVFALEDAASKRAERIVVRPEEGTR